MDMPEIMRKQKLRNELSEIEDEARRLRSDPSATLCDAFDMCAQLVQIIREQVVR